MLRDLPPMTGSQWKHFLQENQDAPTAEDDLDDLADQLTGRASADPRLPPEIAGQILQPCASSAAWLLEQGLRNPLLGPAIRKRILERVTPAPTLASIDRPHFVVNYTPGDRLNQVPADIAIHAADALETAYTLYEIVYGAKIVPDGSKCQVTFAEGPNWTKPDGTMGLSCGGFKLEGLNPEGRRLVCFHEAFHLLQFVSGFTVPGNEWFLEGTATWAEIVHGSDPARPAITAPAKLTAYWERQATPIAKAKYTTVPFFLNIDAICVSDTMASGQLMKEIVNTFKANYPNPGRTSVPDQISRCVGAHVRLGAPVSIESLWVNWLAKMAQGNWNVTRSGQPLYPVIFDGSRSDFPPIEIPKLQPNVDRVVVLTEPGNSWESEETIVASKPYIGQVNFRLRSDYPPPEYTASVNPKTFVGTMSEPLSIFEYEEAGARSGTGPEVVAGESCERSYHDPQLATVYIVFVGEYDYSVQYHFLAKVTRTA